MHEGQQRAWDSKARFTFVLAGTQSGKTSWGPWWLWREIEATARPDEPNDYLAVTSSFDLFKLKLLPELRTVFERILRIGRYWPSNRFIELRDPETGEFWASQADDPMWGRVILRSAASDGGLESATAKAAWLDECGQDEFTLETWEAVLRRLSLSEGRVLGTTTPYNLGWLKSEVHDRWQRIGTANEKPGDSDFRVVQFPSYWNPVFPRREFERAKATMPKHRFEMFYQGLLSRPAGLIYDCYRDEIGGHLVEPFAIPAGWPRYVGVDFGAVNTALVWLAQNPETGVFTVYRESLSGGLSTQEHCANNLALAASENVVGWYGGSGSEDQQRRDWMQAGVPVLPPPIGDVEGGIDRVTGLLKTFKLRVFRSCVGLRDEFGSYKRKLDTSGQALDEIENKRAFHRLDALRYVACGLVGGEVRFGENPW